jgi:hypothetical protein
LKKNLNSNSTAPGAQQPVTNINNIQNYTNYHIEIGMGQNVVVNNEEVRSLDRAQGTTGSHVKAQQNTTGVLNAQGKRVNPNLASGHS